MEPNIKSETLAAVNLPRITIRYCTQCKWMLRAAYFAQELLSTFSTSIGEVALIPSTGGVFTVDLVHTASQQEQESSSREYQPKTQTSRLWDRKTESGFPEVKHLKQLVRNIIDPTRDLGHVDRHKNPTSSEPPANEKAVRGKETSTANDKAETTILTDLDAGIALGLPDDSEKGSEGKSGKTTNDDA